MATNRAAITSHTYTVNSGGNHEAALNAAASASDNVGVVGVQFKLDKVTLGSEDTSSPYSVTGNATQASDGSSSLNTGARDATGNNDTAAGVAVTVNNTLPAPPKGLRIVN